MSSIKKSKKNFNKRKPIGLFKFNKILSQYEFDKIEKQITETFGEKRFIILSGDVEYIPFARKRSNKVIKIRTLKSDVKTLNALQDIDLINNSINNL